MGARVAVITGSPDKEDEAKELGAERFISEEGTALSEALLDWEGGANVILATAPSTKPMTDALPGLAPDGTLAVLGAAAGEISVSPMDLIGARRHLIGSPSGSRKDIRDALQFAAAHDVRPPTTTRPLAAAADAPHA